MSRLLAPDPLRAQPYGSIGGPFADGAALVANTAISQHVVLAGVARWRLRLRSTAAGTLAVRYARADAANTLYTAAQPADVAVTANTEATLAVPEHYGEGVALVTFTPSAAGNLTYCDLSTV